MRIRSSDLIHRYGWMPMWAARDSTALVRCSARVHIGDVTVYVTWHVLWRTQWTLTTGMVVVTIGVKPAHLQLSDSTTGPALGDFIIYWSFSDKGQRIRQGQILLMLLPQRQRTVFLTISVFRITSLLEWTVTKQKLQWVVLHIQCMFSWRFLNA